ncbi:hypothetical protein [Sinorhizobium meliloti]|uniref:hypothetical protein n=1 Tax=Rhizobium meliloti TaxID=382 RepID=UPI003F157D9C
MTVSHRFFAVDRRIWKQICSLGLNEAVSYLVIAAGSGRDHATSWWSATAIEKHTGMHHRRAKEAIQNLERNGFLSIQGRGKLRRTSLHRASSIEAVIASGSSHSELDEPDWIWLPQALVEGAADEMPPIKLLRQSQDIDALRLFVELYYHHDLPGSGGIEWRQGIGIRHRYIRVEAGEHGIYKVWAFKPLPEGAETWEVAPFWFDGIWGAWGLLRRAGLIEFVPHLVEADTKDAEIISPLALNTGEPGEKAIGAAATRAGRLMAAPWFSDPDAVIVPVPAVRPNVQLIGVARLKYRPNTTKTAQWLAFAPEWQNATMGFEELAQSVKASGIKGVV